MMGFFKDMQIKSKFKKGQIVNSSEMPKMLDRAKFLADYSFDNDIPIVISSQERWGELKYANPNVHILRLAPNFTLEIRDVELPNGVLIDESVSIEMIGWLRENSIEIRGGFR